MVRSVEFFLDDPAMARRAVPRRARDSLRAGGGGWDGNAIAWDVTKLSPGAHTLTYRTTWNERKPGERVGSLHRATAGNRDHTAVNEHNPAHHERTTRPTRHDAATTTRPPVVSHVERLPEPCQHRRPGRLGTHEGAQR